MSRGWIITEDQFLTQGQVHLLYKRLKDACDLALLRKRFYSHVRDYHIIRFLFETGLRSFELSNTKIGFIGSTSLIIPNGKGGKKRNIKLMRQTLGLVKNYLKIKANVLGEPIGSDDYLFLSQKGNPYSTSNLRLRVRYWFNQCDLFPSNSCHCARHTFISHCLENGLGIVFTRDQAGHASISTTNSYLHSINKEMEDMDLYKMNKENSRIQ